MGVRYVLEGSVRRAGDQVRINAQLIDATTGGHIWAERYDENNENAFALQDRVIRRIVDALAVKLSPTEKKGGAVPKTQVTAAYDAYLQGLSFYNRRTPRENATARDHFQKAVKLDPDFIAAYTALAKVYMRGVLLLEQYSLKLGFDWLTGTTKIWKFLEAAKREPNSDFYLVRSKLSLKRHQPERAVLDAERALDLSANSVDAMEALAEALIYAGKVERALETIAKAKRQSPAEPAHALYLTALAEFSQGNSSTAKASIERALQHAPDQIYFLVLKAAIHGDLGEVEQAKAVHRVFIKKTDVAWWYLEELVALYPFTDAAVMERFARGLLVTGLRNSSGAYLPLNRDTRLSGKEIKTLLFGKRIEGKGFARGFFGSTNRTWQQVRLPNGKVQHFGASIQPGVYRKNTGSGRIDGDSLCEIWPDLTSEFELCTPVFRMPPHIDRVRWGDYVLLTDSGPYPFSVSSQ
ncbi:MAG: hypothetical protein GY948_03220 [Alphaproteobacteria bacterium]|nr:hypothetical protein [Alphaproteobacteria bacterium]